MWGEILCCSASYTPYNIYIQIAQTPGDPPVRVITEHCVYGQETSRAATPPSLAVTTLRRCRDTGVSSSMAGRILTPEVSS